MNKALVSTAHGDVVETPASPIDAVLRWIGNREKWEDEFVTLAMRNPLESLAALLFGASALFYAAEVGVNAKVKTFWDALYYISTCASVGYADVFATTNAGKAMASMVFLFGPALCAKVFDRALPETRAAPPGVRAVINRLDAILAELRQRP